MSERKWLPVVLKARQAVEDQAAQQVANAQLEQQRAIANAIAETARMDAMSDLDATSTAAFLATAAAQRAAAATHAAAHHRIDFVERQLQMSIDELKAAARDRRSAQKLVEREVAERQAAALVTAQRELDDLTVTRWGRNEPA
jgi:flagellar biosynthesis chaperone FliJ